MRLKLTLACTVGLMGCGLLDGFDKYSLKEIQAVADKMQAEQPGLDGACADGDPASCWRIGVQMMYGTWGREKDEVGGIDFLRRACDAEHDYGCHDLGVAYKFGRGVEQDYAEARRFFEASCPAVTNSCHYIGNMYESGRGALKDDEQARIWYDKACRAGDSSSCDRLL